MFEQYINAPIFLEKYKGMRGGLRLMYSTTGFVSVLTIFLDKRLFLFLMYVNLKSTRSVRQFVHHLPLLPQLICGETFAC